MRGRFYLISGFTILALAFVGATAWVGLTVKGVVNSIEGFRTYSLPTQRTISLEKKHYVLYYQSPIRYRFAAEAPRMSVAITSALAPQPLSILPYTSSLTYSLGEGYSVAEYTADPPRAGRYLVRASSEFEGGHLVIGESISALALRGLIRGLLAFVIFFGVGGVGVSLLTLHDRQVRKREDADAPAT